MVEKRKVNKSKILKQVQRKETGRTVFSRCTRLQNESDKRPHITEQEILREKGTDHIFQGI